MRAGLDSSAAREERKVQTLQSFFFKLFKMKMKTPTALWLLKKGPVIIS